MPQVNLGSTDLATEINKSGTGAKSLHPEGEFEMLLVGIEFNCIKTVQKQHKENYFFMHWKSKEGLQYDYVSLSPKAIFNFANRAKATNCGVSNPAVVNYAGMVGRYAKITVEHESKEKKDGVGTYEVSNVKYVNISQNQQQSIDLSNPMYANAPVIMQGYQIDVPEEAQGFTQDTTNIGNPPPMQQGYNPAQGQQPQYQQNNYQQPQQQMGQQQNFQQPQTQTQNFQQPQQQVAPPPPGPDPYAQNFQGQNQQPPPPQQQVGPAPIDDDSLPF